MPQTREPHGVALRRLLERLSDVDLAERLRAEGCDGPLWLIVREDLARVGVGTLHALILNGGVAGRTRRLGRPVVLGPDETALLRSDRDERSTVVDDAVVHGLRVFRDRGVLGEQWAPGASSLRTYAVNACLMQASRAVRDWRRGRRPQQRCEYREDVLPDVTDDPVDVDAVLDLLPPELYAAAVERLRSGRSWAAIAPEIGATARLLERQLRRFREEHGRRLREERS